MIAVDTNVLVYARREELSQHAPALSALKALAEGDLPWAIPLYCVGEFVRVVSHPRLFAPPTDPVAALRFVDQLLASPTAHLLLPGQGFIDLLARLLAETGVRGNLVFDAQIAALCIECGASRILTEDRDFSRFNDLTLVSLAEFNAS